MSNRFSVNKKGLKKDHVRKNLKEYGNVNVKENYERGRVNWQKYLDDSDDIETFQKI